MSWTVHPNQDHFDVFLNEELVYSIVPVILYSQDGKIELVKEIHVKGREPFLDV